MRSMSHYWIIVLFHIKNINTDQSQWPISNVNIFVDVNKLYLSMHQIA